uniref:Uncharacterized protein n=1 Tax=Meloidogyne enterolobii TaxID=390850 RepID=A0A6V7YA10_MELEN|nr:unnamed protein product [Meloidogyne enterolobii]
MEGGYFLYPGDPPPFSGIMTLHELIEQLEDFKKSTLHILFSGVTSDRFLLIYSNFDPAADQPPYFDFFVDDAVRYHEDKDGVELKNIDRT